MSYSGVHSPTGQSHIQHIMGGCKKPDTFAVVFPHVIFFPSYRFPKRRLLPLIKEFIMRFLGGMLAYNPPDLHLSFRKKHVSARLENDAMEY